MGDTSAQVQLLIDRMEIDDLLAALRSAAA